MDATSPASAAIDVRPLFCNNLSTNLFTSGVPLPAFCGLEKYAGFPTLGSAAGLLNVFDNIFARS